MSTFSVPSGWYETHRPEWERGGSPDICRWETQGGPEHPCLDARPEDSSTVWHWCLVCDGQPPDAWPCRIIRTEEDQ